MTAAEDVMNLQMVLSNSVDRHTCCSLDGVDSHEPAVIVIQLSKWTPRLRWCQLVGLQYHQVRRYCSQVDGDAGGWCANRNLHLNGLSLSRLDAMACINSEMKKCKAGYRLCSSGARRPSKAPTSIILCISRIWN